MIESIAFAVAIIGIIGVLAPFAIAAGNLTGEALAEEWRRERNGQSDLAAIRKMLEAAGPEGQQPGPKASPEHRRRIAQNPPSTSEEHT